MPSVSFKIVDVSGAKSTVVEVPDNALVSQVLHILIRKMDLTPPDGEGRTGFYEFHHLESGAILDAGQTLADAGVSNGDTLRIRMMEGTAPAGSVAGSATSGPTAPAPDMVADDSEEPVAPGDEDDEDDTGDGGEDSDGAPPAVGKRKRKKGAKGRKSAKGPKGGKGKAPKAQSARMVRPWVIVLAGLVFLVLCSLGGYTMGLRIYQSHQTRVDLESTLDIMTSAVEKNELERIRYRIKAVEAIIESANSRARPELEQMRDDWVAAIFARYEAEVQDAILAQSWDETRERLTQLSIFDEICGTNPQRTQRIAKLQERCKGAGVIRFTGDIDGVAEVYRGETLLGTTDQAITNLIIGLHRLEVRLEGYRPSTYDVTIPPTGDIEVLLRPFERREGSILIEAARIGADGQMQIVTEAEVKMGTMPWTTVSLPWEKKEMPPQRCLVQVRLAGYQTEVTQVLVHDRETSTLSFIFKPMPGRLLVECPLRDVSIWETTQNQRWGQVNQAITNIPSGVYTIELRLPNHHSQRVQVEIPPDGLLRHSAPALVPRLGAMRIIANTVGAPLNQTNAILKINGELKGTVTLPYHLPRLTEGIYKVELDVENCHPVEPQNVPVYDRKESRPVFNIRPLEGTLRVESNVPVTIFHGMMNLGRGGEDIQLTANERHALTIAADGYPPIKRTVVLKPAEEAELRLADFVLPAQPVLDIDLGDGVSLRLLWLAGPELWGGQFEVTNEQFRKFRPEHDSGSHNGLTLNSPQQPAAQISWESSMAFAAWVTKRWEERLPVGYVVRLPSVKEWMAMAECGAPRVFPWGNDWPPQSGNYGNIAGFDDGFEVACDVTKSGRNDWDLYGLGGNVWEWCLDAWSKGSSTHLVKGASWDVAFGQKQHEVSFRRGLEATYKDQYMGFRVVCGRVIEEN